MPLSIATHHGTFHADDVLAVALIRAFLDEEATVDRTRDPDRLASADVVIDVGGEYDPSRRRFDHHQKSYTGPLSSAGMVLQWLLEQGRIEPGLHDLLRTRVVDYVDDVDNGRVEPLAHVPCFASMVQAANRGALTLADFDRRFEEAVFMADILVAGVVGDHQEMVEAEAEVRLAMDRAAATGSNLLVLGSYLRWKPAYFALGGAVHPTEFVTMPGLDGSARVIAIPPQEGSFAQKRPLPASWAGLVDQELEAACGVPGARFCHKNLFIAVFDTQEHLLQAMAAAGVLTGPAPA